MKKIWLNWLKFFKKPTGLVWFRFYKFKIKKTEPSSNKKNMKKTESNQFESVFFKKSNRTKIDRFELISIFFKKKKISI